MEWNYPIVILATAASLSSIPNPGRSDSTMSPSFGSTPSPYSSARSSSGPEHSGDTSSGRTPLRTVDTVRRDAIALIAPRGLCGLRGYLAPDAWDCGTGRTVVIDGGALAHA